MSSFRTRGFGSLSLIFLAGLSAIGVIVLLLLSFDKAAALGTIYFDDKGGPGDCDVFDRPGNREICGQTQIRMVVGQTQYVRKTGAAFGVYFRSNRGQLTINNLNWCPGTSYGDMAETEDNDQGVPLGSRVVRVNIPGMPDVYGHRYRKNDGRCNERVQINLTGHLRDGSQNGTGLPGSFWTKVTIEHVDQAASWDGTQNAMDVQLTSGPGYTTSSNDWYIAPLGHNHASGFRGVANTLDADGGPANYSLRVPFGTDCEITRPEQVYLSFFDLDGRNDGGAQKNGAVKIKLKRIPPSGRGVEWLKGINANGSGGDWRPGEPTYAQADEAPGNANDDWNVSFRADPFYQYELQVINIYHNNTIQVSTPYDGIYGVVPCEQPEVTLRPANSWNVSRYLEAGETANFIARLNNRSNKTGYIDDAHGRVWLDGGNRRYDGHLVNGDKRLAENVDYINSTTAVRGPGGRQLSPAQHQFTAEGGYTYLCGRVFDISPAASPPSQPFIQTNIGEYPEAACLPIGKYPALTARGGDVRAGGVVPNSQVTCRLDGIPNFTDLDDLRINGHYYADAGLGAGNPGNRFKGSYGGLGVLSPGPIQEFGSMGGFYRGPGTSSAYGLFGTRAWGATSHSYNQEGYFLGQNANGATATHCLVDVDALYPAPDAVTELSGNATASIKDTRTYRFSTGGGKTLTLNGANFGKGEKATIRITQVGNATTNTVVINGSVNYPDVISTAYGSIAELPQLTIVADKRINVRFADQATVYNGLIATAGNLYTCEGHDGSADISTAACRDKALVINGMTIVGGKLYPFRTEGFNTRGATGTFAETFTLTPELLLSDYARAQQQPKLRVDLQTGLPPRF